MSVTLKNAKLKHKIMFPNVLYLILLVSILFFFFNSKSLITDLSREQAASSDLLQDVRQTAFDIKAYMYGDLSFEDLENDYRMLLSEISSSALKTTLESLWKDVNDVREMKASNDEIENEVMSMTDSSIEISDSFIEQVSQKLADDATKSEVTTLEILTIPGANTNSTANYQVQVQFGHLKERLAEKKRMTDFIDLLLENVEKDIVKLTGTPFEQMARDSKALVEDVKDLTLSFIENVETVNDLQETIFYKIEQMTEDINQIAERSNEQFFAKVLRYFRVIFWIVLFTAIAGVLLTTYFAGSISNLLSRVARGLGEASDQVEASSGELSAASQSLAAGSSEQAASIEETSSSLEEMASMTSQNSENAVRADNLMKTVQEVVGTANDTMTELTGSMNEISTASEETRKIVTTIDEISFQTNLLALNAAVEAARAGEAGAGFAVVADEVRNLAMRAAEAAKNTADLIDDTVKKIQGGAELVTKTDDDFDEVEKTSSEVGRLIAEIAVASKEQAEGVEVVNKAVSGMDSVVQQNAASAEENASASEEMNAQAIQMKEYVAELVKLVEGRITRMGKAVRTAPVELKRKISSMSPYDKRGAGPKAGGVEKRTLESPTKPALPDVTDTSDF